MIGVTRSVIPKHTALEIGVCNITYIPSSPSDTTLAAYCDDVVAMGLKWIRSDMIWGHVQAGGKNSWNWSKYDKFVEIASSRGLKLLFILGYSVGWANGNQSQMYPPTDVADFANFASEAVKRYSPKGVKTWEIWNEPNLPGFWQPAPDATAYANMLKAAYTAIKNVDSSAKVLIAGLASTGNTSTNIAPETFIQTIYDTIGKDYFDAMNYHPYGWSTSSMQRILSTMALNGDRDKKVWFTEYGNPTNGTQGQGFSSEQQQADQAVAAIKNIARMPWVERMFFYAYKDYSPYQPDREGYFGIKRSDDTAKPVFSAIRDTLLS